MIHTAYEFCPTCKGVLKQDLWGERFMSPCSCDDSARVTGLRSGPIQVIKDDDPVVIPLGWQCPVCKTVHAPQITSCSCAKGYKS